MPDIKIARNAGFCFGVKNAVQSVYEAVAQGKRVYTYGEIIHNEHVVEEFASLGVRVIEGPEDIEDEAAAVIIRSHGISRAAYEALRARNVQIIDSTCPFVKRIHRLVENESKKGRVIIIIGDERHPEIQGIIGHCDGEYYVISDTAAAQALSLSIETPMLTIAQTTFLLNNFQLIVAILQKKGYYNNDVHNTICDATAKRQTECEELAKTCDTMLVVGGKSSSNTYKLYEIAKGYCENTLLIQDGADLDTDSVQLKGSIGITAGASTPNNIIEEVHTVCLNKALKKCSKKI